MLAWIERVSSCMHWAGFYMLQGSLMPFLFRGIPTRYAASWGVLADRLTMRKPMLLARQKSVLVETI